MLLHILKQVLQSLLGSSANPQGQFQRQDLSLLRQVHQITIWYYFVIFQARHTLDYTYMYI